MKMAIETVDFSSTIKTEEEAPFIDESLQNVMRRQHLAEETRGVVSINL